MNAPHSRSGPALFANTSSVQNDLVAHSVLLGGSPKAVTHTLIPAFNVYTQIAVNLSGSTERFGMKCPRNDFAIGNGARV
jgi:hypothetical protein